MKPRRGLALAARITAVLLLVLALAAAILMQPDRLARIVLGAVGDAAGLDIAFSGEARYRLRGTPLLEVHDLSVRVPGHDAPLLDAGRALVSLPWSTVRRRGAGPVVLERIELDRPVLDLPRLQAWLAERPAGDGRLPTLDRGIAVRDGRVLGDGWLLRDLQLRIPALAPDAPVRGTARGTLDTASPPLVHFDLGLAASRPADGAGLGARGRLRLEHPDWRLPAAIAASGPLRMDGDALWVAPLRVGISAAFVGDGDPLPFTLGAHGPLRLRGGTATLAPATLVLHGGGPVPALQARGRAALGRALLLEFEGSMPAWPAAWPALPAPLDDPSVPVGFGIAYAGARDLGSPVFLRAHRADARAEAQARVSEVFAWMDGPSTSPLPPLRARASAPRVEVAGAVLEGVEIDIEPGGAR